MKLPIIPNNEAERLQSLKEYHILDTLPEQEFEDITLIASEICQTPIALITLIDTKRQWFKSNRGLNVRETPRDYAFCAHAINTPDKVFTVDDSRRDERFADNPLVTADPNVIFYAGVPLVNPEGFSLGTICVIDHEPRKLSQKQLDSLKALSNQVVKLFEARKTNELLKESQHEIERRNAELEQFAYVLSHDIKSPLNNIIGLMSILKEGQKGKIDQEEQQIINLLANSSLKLRTLIDGIIAQYLGANLDAQNKEEINIESLFTELKDLLDARREFKINYHSALKTIIAHEVALKQILSNLISNAIKYNNKELVKIDITVLDTKDFYEFIVQDNGNGIDQKDFAGVFETFATLGTKDRFNNTGTGIGLSTVKRLVEKLGGAITLESEVGVGSRFKFSVKK